MIYGKLHQWDRAIVKAAHLSKKKIGLYSDTSFQGYCIDKGYLEILKRLTIRYYDNWYICGRAAEHGQLDVIQWACENKLTRPLNRLLCHRAASYGHLHVIQWAAANNGILDSDLCSSAATGGHLHIIQWLRQEEVPWTKNVCEQAAMGGHLHVLKWARENGCPWDKNTTSYAVGAGHLHTLTWAVENWCPIDVKACLNIYCSQAMQDYLNSLL
jgi:hypothetical protein